MYTTSTKAARSATRIAALGLLAGIVVSASAPASAQTLDRIRDTKTIRLGYEPDARPFSFKDEAGQPAGYAVALCTIVADRAKTELGLTELTVEWVPLDGGRSISRREGRLGRPALRRRRGHADPAEGRVLLDPDLPERDRSPRQRLFAACRCARCLRTVGRPAGRSGVDRRRAPCLSR